MKNETNNEFFNSDYSMDGTCCECGRPCNDHDLVGDLYWCNSCVEKSLAADESDRQCEALRNGTARYSTPGEDLGIILVLLGLTVVMIGTVVHFARIIDTWPIPMWFKYVSVGALVALIVVSRIVRHKKGI